MFSCILCLENFKKPKFELNEKVCGVITIKDAIQQQFSYHETLLTSTQSSSSSHPSICKFCFKSFKDFYEYLDKINTRHIFNSTQVKLEEDPKNSNLNFISINELNEEPQVDLKDLRVILHRIKTEPEIICEVKNENSEFNEKNSENYQGNEKSPNKKRKYSSDSDFEWKLDENSEFNFNNPEIEFVAEEKYESIQILNIPKKVEDDSSDSDKNVHVKSYMQRKKRKASSDDDFKPPEPKFKKKPKKPVEPKNEDGNEKPQKGGQRSKEESLELDNKIKLFCGLKCHECNTEIESNFQLTKHFAKFHKGIRRYLMCCYKKFYKRSALIEHILNKHDSQQFPCEYCDKVFKSASGRRVHTKTIHTNPPPPSDETFVCQECGKTFKKNCLFKTHLMQHEYDPNKTFECYKCKRSFRNFISVKKHFYTAHNAQRSKHTTCEVCGVKVSRMGFSLHMKTKHSTEPLEKIQCTICGHWITKLFIKNHMRKHTDQGTTCKVCGKYLKNSYSISHHMKTVHSNAEKKFKCDYCEKSYMIQMKLREHIASVHTREILFRCRVPGCEREFRAQGNWKMHEKRAHPEIYEKIFKPFYKWGPNEQPPPEVEEALKKLSENNQIGTEKVSKCNECGKILPNPESLWNHVREVHVERFKCHLCDKGFYRKMKFKEHMANVHTKEFLFKCKVVGCGKEFRSRSNYRVHEKRAHPGEYENLSMNSNQQSPLGVEEESSGSNQVGGWTFQ